MSRSLALILLAGCASVPAQTAVDAAREAAEKCGQVQRYADAFAECVTITDALVSAVRSGQMASFEALPDLAESADRCHEMLRQLEKDRVQP